MNQIILDKFANHKISNALKSSLVGFNSESIIMPELRDGFRIMTEQARYPLKNIKEIFKSHNLNPEYQRNIVWDIKKRSKLIESFIINIPIPSIFLYEVEFSQYEIMDGKQRVSTLISFFNDEFALQELEYYPSCNGLKYSELPDEIKGNIDRRYLSATILLKETAKDEKEESFMKRLVFERLNTGGVELNRQEIRNALYPSLFNNLLSELANLSQFDALWTGKKKNRLGKNDFPEERGEKEELILRFFAYIGAVENNISKSTAFILDNYMRKAMEFTEDDNIFLKRIFIETLYKSEELFGVNAFKSEERSKYSEKMIFDAVMLYSLNNMDKQGDFSQRKFDIIRINKDDVFNGKYTAISNVKARVEALIKGL